jgi:RNA methyltransferase, TrmH family
MLPITSLQNPRVKEAVRLRDSRQRAKQGRIVIDGARELRRAIAGGVKLEELFICESLCKGDDARWLLDALPSLGCEVLQVNETVFEKVAFGHRTDGVLGVAKMPRTTLASVAERLDSSTHAPLIVVLEGVEKPGNVGAVLRTADAAGVSALIVADGRTDLFNPNAIRASLGTIFTVPVCEATSNEALDWLRERNTKIFAARVDGSVPYTEADYRGPTAIVLGSEAEGLSQAWTADNIAAIRLPMLGIADSLNVSVTAAVIVYEAMRQREGSGRGEGRVRH